MEKITCCHHLHTKFLLSNLIFTSLIINSNSLTPRLHLFILLPCICAHIYIVIHHARSLIAHCVVRAARGRSEDDQLVGEEGHGQPHRLHDLHRRHQRRHRPRARQRHLLQRRLDGAISTPVHIPGHVPPARRRPRRGGFHGEIPEDGRCLHGRVQGPKATLQAWHRTTVGRSTQSPRTCPRRRSTRAHGTPCLSSSRTRVTAWRPWWT